MDRLLLIQMFYLFTICEKIQNTPGPEEKAILKCLMSTARRQEVSSRTWFLTPYSCKVRKITSMGGFFSPH